MSVTSGNEFSIIPLPTVWMFLNVKFQNKKEEDIIFLLYYLKIMSYSLTDGLHKWPYFQFPNPCILLEQVQFCCSSHFILSFAYKGKCDWKLRLSKLSLKICLLLKEEIFFKSDGSTRSHDCKVCKCWHHGHIANERQNGYQ